MFGPFLMLFFGIVGVGLFYFSETVLDQAVASAARQIRTGQSHVTPSGELTVGNFKTEICSRTAGLINCSKLAVNIQSGSSWGQFKSTASCTKSDGTVGPSNYADNIAVSQGAGGREQVVVIVVCYPWELLASLPYIGLGNVNGGNAQLIQSILAFKSEPY